MCRNVNFVISKKDREKNGSFYCKVYSTKWSRQNYSRMLDNLITMLNVHCVSSIGLHVISKCDVDRANELDNCVLLDLGCPFSGWLSYNYTGAQRPTLLSRG